MQTQRSPRLCKLSFMLALLMVSLVITVPLQGSSISTRNQFNLSVTTFGDEALPDASLEFLWQPDITVKHPISERLSLGMELSMQNRLSSQWDKQDMEIKTDVYRYLFRCDTPQSELRIGLQRINFGSAQILRPLQWFDTLKPLDKLEQTRGAKALLARHYFDNNSNLWLWGMLADEDLKGNEVLPSKADSPEWGGRYQFPNPLGESALSFHSRELDLGREYRAGFDHRLDTFAGAWVEASGSLMDSGSQDNRLSTTIGLDYTVGIGNGVVLTCENMSTFSKPDKVNQVTALMGVYPLGLLDSVMLISTWNWDESFGIANLLWRRTYDLFSIELSLSVDSGMPAQISNSPAVNLTISYNP